MARVITDYLEQTAALYPDKPAYIDPDRTLTFARTRQEAMHVAQGLIGKGIFRRPAAVYLDKSVSCIAAMFGVAYSGNYYTVLDTSMPAQRIDRILSVLEPAVILTDEAHAEDAAAFAGSVEICTYEDLMQTVIDEARIRAVTKAILPTDILYVLFTSGSTGNPKGVITPHQAVTNYIDALEPAYHLTAEDSFVNQAPLYFVLSIVEIYSVICYGCTMHMVPKIYYSFPAMIMNYIAEHQISILYWVPSALTMIANTNAFEVADISGCVRLVAFGGEVMPIRQLRQWREALPDTVFINAYGPTETTDGCTYYVIDREFEDNERLPIGIPFANIGVLILDEENREVTEAGGIGELCVFGPSVTYGYYREPEKTAEVFVRNPLNPFYDQKIYHTGDLVQLNGRGEMEFVGRRDFQIKHMGHRIELGEIEANVSAIPGVEENACLYDNVKQRIVLYYTGAEDPKDLKKRLEGMVPEYMMPQKRIRLDVMPHNLHGKIDRAKLKTMYAEENTKA